MTDPCCVTGYPRKKPPVACDDLPLADGVASAGVSPNFSKCDHVHPLTDGSKLASMVYQVARAAAATTGNEDVLCVNEDPSNPVAFKPTWVELLLTHDGNAPQVGSKGSAMLTDGTAVVRQGVGYFFDIGGVDFSKCYDTAIGYVFSNPAAGTSWFVTLVAAPATTTLRLAWVKGGAGLDIHGVLKITGIIP